MEVSVRGTPFEAEVIRELLSPWGVAFVEAEKSGVEIVCGRKPVDGKKSVVIPSESVDFVEWTKKESLRIVRRPGEQISVAASTEAVLEFSPQSLYVNNSSVDSPLGSSVLLQINIDANVLVLTVDIIREYSRILNQTLNAKSSKTYDLLTRMPLPYDVAPKRVKDLLMAKHGKQRSVAIFERLPLDALRFALARALEKICGFVLHRRNWGSNKDYACVLTHDIDSRRGLQNARYVKKLEEKYDIPSTWYVPSKSYSLDLEVLKDLENCGEVGSHDTVHDGRLVQLSGQALTNRLFESRNDLEKTAGLSIEGFRAPLLQHTFEILRRVGDAGYKYDSSIPTWSPSTLGRWLDMAWERFIRFQSRGMLKYLLQQYKTTNYFMC